MSEVANTNPHQLLIANPGDQFVLEGQVFTLDLEGQSGPLTGRRVFLSRLKEDAQDEDYEWLHVRRGDDEIALLSRRELVDAIVHNNYTIW